MARQALKLRYLDGQVLQKVGSLDLAVREVVEGLRAGMHKSPLRGFSTEFVHHRPYVPGDEIRHVDWRVYGRTERYYVKLYEAETNFDAHLLLDVSSSMRYGSGTMTKLEYAKYLSACLSYLIVEQRDSAGVATFDNQLRHYVEPSSTWGVIGTIERVLENIEPQPKTDVAGLLHQFAQRINRRGVVMVFSDLFDDVEGFIKGLDHLRFGGHNVSVFHILDPYELDFPFSGTCRFAGLEGEDDIVTQPKRIREEYLREVESFCRQVRQACERSQVDYKLVRTDTPLDVTLADYLLRHSTRAIHPR